MQLYRFPPSPNSLRCQAVANDLGIELDLITVKLPEGEQLREEFVRLNPNHKIPTLVHGDFVLWESTAIIQYLAALAAENSGTQKLVPASIRDQARMQQWLAWNLAHWAPALGTLVFEHLVKAITGGGAADPGEVAVAEENFHRFAAVLDGHLRGRKTLVGEDLSLADHAVGSFLIYEKAGRFPMDDYGEIQRWWAPIQGGEAWQRALATVPNAAELLGGRARSQSRLSSTASKRG